MPSDLVTIEIVVADMGLWMGMRALQKSTDSLRCIRTVLQDWI